MTYSNDVSDVLSSLFIKILWLSHSWLKYRQYLFVLFHHKEVYFTLFNKQLSSISERAKALEIVHVPLRCLVEDTNILLSLYRLHKRKWRLIG